LFTQALLLLRRPPCWNKHGSTHSSRSTRSSRLVRHVERVESSLRDKPSGIWAYTNIRTIRAVSPFADSKSHSVCSSNSRFQWISPKADWL